MNHDRPGRGATHQTARRLAGALHLFLGALMLIGGTGSAGAQQLEPRAYAPAPIGLNFVGAGVLYSSGGVVTDPSLPVENVEAQVYVAAPYYARTFGLIGRLATVTAGIPFGRADVQGEVQEVSRSVERSGLLDPQVRLGINLLGCPALTPREFAGHERATNVGLSFSVNVPLGQYDPAKLINLGTNRWAIKPELGLTQPFGDWTFEVYGGAWLYQDNPDFYGGHRREQDPLATFQTHVVRNFGQRAWLAANFTYYNGGTTTVGGIVKNDRQDNTRGGLTLSVVSGRNQNLKLTWAEGVSTRIGSSFRTFGLGWQLRWF